MKVTVLLLAFVASVQAADYEPVNCDAPKVYAGEPRHPPVDLSFDVSGSLDGEFDDATVQRFEVALDKAMTGTAARSMTVAVGVPETGLWTSERAAAEVALTADMHYWASAGKALTALAILTMVEESRLTLTEAVSTFVDGVPNGDVITIEALLNHTNGLFSVNEDLQVRQRQTGLTLDESLDILRKHGAMFCPGEYWRYTNTGYALLGHILEVLGEGTLDEVIATEVLDPLGLENIRVLTTDDSLDDVATLFSSDPSVDAMNPESAGAAGPMAASSEAVVRFWHAVLSAQVVSPEILDRMFEDLYPMFGGSTYYGLGVMAYVVPQPDGSTKLWLGHSGGAPGVQAVFAYSPSDHGFVAVALSGDGSAEATANLLLTALADPS